MCKYIHLLYLCRFTYQVTIIMQHVNTTLNLKKKKVKTHYSVTMINKVLASPVCNYIAFCASEKNSSFFGAWR